MTRALEIHEHIADVTQRCLAMLSEQWGDQHIVMSHDGRTGKPVAFEFWWPTYGVPGAVCLKLVVSDATEVGVENMK